MEAISILQQLLKLLTIVTVGSSILLICVFILIWILLLFYNVVDSFQPGKLHVTYVLFIFSRLVWLCFVTLNAWYLNATSQGTVLTDLYPKTFYIFRWWDAENKRIFPEHGEAVLDHPHNNRNVILSKN